LPLMGTLVIYARSRGRAAPSEWFAAGCCAAFSLLFKPIDVYLLTFLAVVWIAEAWVEKRSLMTVLRAVICGFAGGVLTTTAVVAWFLIKDGGRSLWEAVITFNFYYSRFGTEGAAVLEDQMKVLWRYWWFVAVAVIWLAIRRPPRWWFYLGLPATAFLGVYQGRGGHYYLLLAPFFALVATAAIQDIFAALEKNVRVDLRFMRNAFVGAVAFLLFLPVLQLVRLTPDELTEWLYDSRNPFVESPEVAGKTAALTKPDDYIYVAGSEPQILYYAKRRSSSRFIISYPLMLDTPMAARYQEQAIQELKQHPPAVVVFARSNLSWSRQRTSPEVLLPYVATMLRQQFRLVGGFVRSDQKTGWVEPLTGEQMLQSSLLVFERRRDGS